MRTSSTIEARSVRLLIMWYSRSGVLKSLADRLEEGAHLVAGVEVQQMEVHDHVVQPTDGEADIALRRTTWMERLAAADALIVGSPAYFGSMASPIKRLFEDCLTAPVRTTFVDGLVADGAPFTVDCSRPWRSHLFRDKVGAAFTASGTPHGGNELALQSITLTLFMHLGMIVVTPGQGEPILEKPAAPYGATAVAGAAGDQRPSALEQEAARALGEQVARVTAWQGV